MKCNRVCVRRSLLKVDLVLKDAGHGHSSLAYKDGWCVMVVIGDDRQEQRGANFEREQVPVENSSYGGGRLMASPLQRDSPRFSEVKAYLIWVPMYIPR